MANPYLGEIEMEIGDRTIYLRPTFEAIVEIETRTKQSLFQLVNKHARGETTMIEIVAMIYGGMIGAREKNGEIPGFAKLGEMIVSTAGGYAKLYPPVGQLIGAAVSGRPIHDIVPPESKKKPEASETEPKQ